MVLFRHGANKHVCWSDIEGIGYIHKGPTAKYARNFESVNRVFGFDSWIWTLLVYLSKGETQGFDSESGYCWSLPTAQYSANHGSSDMKFHTMANDLPWSSPAKF